MYVIYGKQTPFVLIDLNNLSPLDGYPILGVSSSDALGLSVSGAGVNYLVFVCIMNYKLLNR